MLNASTTKIKRRSFTAKLTILMGIINNAFNIDARIEECLKHEQSLNKSRYLRGKKTSSWHTFSAYTRLLAAIFVWPIVTALVVICIGLPLTIIHHAIVTVADFISELYKYCSSPAKNDVSAPISPTTSNSTSSNTPVTDAIASLYAKLPNNPITSAYNMFCASNNSKTQDIPKENETLDVNPFRSYRVDFV